MEVTFASLARRAVLQFNPSNSQERSLGKQFSLQNPAAVDFPARGLSLTPPDPAVNLPARAEIGLIGNRLARANIVSWMDGCSRCSEPALYAFFVTASMQIRAIDTLESGALADVRPTLGWLLRRKAATGGEAVVLAYAAPSDDTFVGQEMLDAVERLRDALDIFDLPLLDYLVVGPTRTFGIGSW